MQRNLSIDLIKVVAMMMVLLLHTGVERHFSLLHYNDVGEVYIIAGIAIPMFFMVSGYLLSPRTPDYKYSMRKIFGILKFCFIVCFTFDVLIYIKSGFVNMSFPSCYLQKGQFSVFWYFGSMLIIYMLLPFLLRCIKDSRKLWWLFGIAFVISTIAFVIDSMCRFEKSYIIQSFRLWYWIMYFLLGAIIRNHEQWLVSKASFWFIPITCAVCLLENKLVNVGGNEYLFGSIPCILYAMSVFVWILKLNKTDSKMIGEMSKLFLPVYAIHELILPRLINRQFMNDIDLTINPYLAITFEYAICALVILTVCYILMKIPYMDRIFKI